MRGRGVVPSIRIDRSNLNLGPIYFLPLSPSATCRMHMQRVGQVCLILFYFKKTRESFSKLAPDSFR